MVYTQVPGANLNTGNKPQYPPGCFPDKNSTYYGTNAEPLYLKANLTGDFLVEDTGEHTLKWATHFSAVDWLVLLAIFFDTFGMILKFMPILSGRPTEMESAKEIKCSGRGSVSFCSIILLYILFLLVFYSFIYNLIIRSFFFFLSLIIYQLAFPHHPTVLLTPPSPLSLTFPSFSYLRSSRLCYFGQ